MNKRRLDKGWNIQMSAWMSKWPKTGIYEEVINKINKYAKQCENYDNWIDKRKANPGNEWQNE